MDTISYHDYRRIVFDLVLEATLPARDLLDEHNALQRRLWHALYVEDATEERTDKARRALSTAYRRQRRREKAISSIEYQLRRRCAATVRYYSPIAEIGAYADTLDRAI